MAKAVGIDLGTTNSAIAFMDGDRPEVIVNTEGMHKAARWTLKIP